MTGSPSDNAAPERRALPIGESRMIFLRTAWPVTIEMILVSVIETIDMMMVGSLGPAAIAAVSLNNQPRQIVQLFIIALNAGVMSAVARRKGIDDREGAIRCLRLSVLVSVVLSAVLLALVELFAGPIMLLCGAQPDTIENAVVYCQVTAVGYFFYSVGLTLTAAQRGIGNTGISLRTSLSANLVNIFFNYLLIGGHFGFPALGVFGAALATAAGSTTSFFMALYSVSAKKSYLCLFARIGRGEGGRAQLRGILSISRSVLVEKICQRIGVLISVRIVAGLGTVAFATYSICQRFTNLAFSIGDGLGIAAAALIAQCLGAERVEEGRTFGRAGIQVSFATSFLFSALIILLRVPVVKLFTEDATVLVQGSECLIIIAVISLAHINQTLLGGILRGAGDARFVAWVAIVCTMLLRPAASWLLCSYLTYGVYGSCIAIAAATYCRLGLTMKRFSGGKWMHTGVL